MDANLATLLGLVITGLIASVTQIVLAVLNNKKSNRIEKKVDDGNAVNTATHTIANGRTEQLLRELAEKNEEIARLNRELPPVK